MNYMRMKIGIIIVLLSISMSFSIAAADQPTEPLCVAVASNLSENGQSGLIDTQLSEMYSLSGDRTSATYNFLLINQLLFPDVYTILTARLFLE